MKMIKRSDKIVFDQVVSKSGKIEYRTTFGRGKSLVFKKSRGGYYFLDLMQNNVKFNLALDELDALFDMRGHLESLTAFFEKPHTQQNEVKPENAPAQQVPYTATPVHMEKENAPPYSHTLPQTPYFHNFSQQEQPTSMQSPQTLISQRTPLQPIPVVVSAKRKITGPGDESENKRMRYDCEDISPANAFSDFTNNELEQFFNPMW